MTINVWSYLDEFKEEKLEIEEAINSVLHSGQLILGPQVTAFEEEYANFCGSSHAVGVGNGTDAITIGLRALGIGVGDEVITVSNTAVPTVSGIIDSGATPRFVDINPKTYLMDANLLEGAINEKTTCILPVHLFGQCADMDKISAIARKHNLKIFEDCAQAHGATYKSRSAGTLGHASSTSFYPTKILGTFGDGGMILTGEEKVMEKIRRLRFYGMEKQYFSMENGINSRLDELHASILRVKLSKLENYIAKRQKIAARYDEALKDTSLVLPSRSPYNDHAYYLYVVAHPQRDQILEKLLTHDIRLNVSYRWPIHTMPPFKHFLAENENLAETDKAAARIFSLPMYPSLKEEDQEKVIKVIKSIL
jgi:dTDP-3-amino-2,3,6-trideoxy-4-keto-D-glucose/dTDP-3-amino-3,4,6-trideoxy-alpha-D-glucose/dTDP-2,6-dideoxy-D-kanosamine transaminase